MNNIEVIKVASFELIREKREKKIKSQIFFTESIPSDMKDALDENLNALLSLPEAEVKRDTGKNPPIIYDTPLLNKIRDNAQSKCFIVDFIDDTKLDLISSLQNNGQDDVFKEITGNIANHLKGRPRWPVCLIIIVQFRVSGIDDAFIGILTTDLKVGEHLTYDTKQILKELTNPISDRYLAKGLIFPHIVIKDGELTTENRVKIYQKSDANYFYDFLSLNRPLDPEKHFNEKYSNISSLKEFDQIINPNDKEYIKYTIIKVLIDNLKIEGILYSDLKRKIKFAELPDSDIKIVVIEGHEIVVKIGDKELNADFSEANEIRSLFGDKNE
ncbi:MAG: hypothetical protein C4B59_09355 [Candidatus Methanogaster sp.]|uniref:Uncharacterized protein n=1 Tax=Candidatus Methanogaster sp. TaxID=3386292 RepID=A0AC61L2B0_9EURY|nr:MAG: hypothetical protein C4B59_09355 [ANME-2 cluster archaeon]